MNNKFYKIPSRSSSIQNLPLSWSISLTSNRVSTIKINNKALWLNGGSLKSIENFTSEVEKFSKKKQIIIRGCNKSVTNKLKENDYHSTLFAKEAIIELKNDTTIPAKLSKKNRWFIETRRSKRDFIHIRKCYFT